MTKPAAALNDLSRSPMVRFSLLALSSIFFLVDPFAATLSFLAITENAGAAQAHGAQGRGDMLHRAHQLRYRRAVEPF